MLRLAALIAISTAVWSQTADTVLLNGKILTVDSQFSTREAIAIRGGRILGTGSTADIRKLAGPATRTIDLQGRTVIPGLIDSHLHAIRAALSFSTEVNWIGARSLPEALARIRNAARTMKPEAWLIEMGGEDFELSHRISPAAQTAVAGAVQEVMRCTNQGSLKT